MSLHSHIRLAAGALLFSDESVVCFTGTEVKRSLREWKFCSPVVDDDVDGTRKCSTQRHYDGGCTGMA